MLCIHELYTNLSIPQTLIRKLYPSGIVSCISRVNLPQTSCLDKTHTKCSFMWFYYRCVLIEIPEEYSIEIDSYWHLNVANKLQELFDEE